jgi:hypothetical protein
MAGFQLVGPAANASKFRMVQIADCMGRPRALYNNPGVPQCSAAEVGYAVYLDLILLNPGLGSTSHTNRVASKVAITSPIFTFRS